MIGGNSFCKLTTMAFWKFEKQLLKEMGFYPDRAKETGNRVRGCVYVMRSEFVPGWCKIGFTTRDPEQRAAELSTGLPGRLEVYAECVTKSDLRETEKQIHALLDRYRHTPKDEWFKIDAVKATKLIRQEFGIKAITQRQQIQDAFLGLVIIVVAILIFGLFL